MDSQKNTFDSLPEELKEELVKRHTHAEIVYAQNPSQIVYREEDVIEMMDLSANMLLNQVSDAIELVKKNAVQDSWMSVQHRPSVYGRYEVYRAGAKKQHYEVWNGTGWAYNNIDITHWRPIIPPEQPLRG